MSNVPLPSLRRRVKLQNPELYKAICAEERERCISIVRKFTMDEEALAASTRWAFNLHKVGERIIEALHSANQ